jgi:hypothetical protein
MCFLRLLILARVVSQLAKGKAVPQHTCGGVGREKI